jgi:hypothetical protein
MHLIDYLIHWPNLKIKYSKGAIGGLDGFTDADWGNSVSRKSTNGLAALYNREPVLWRLKMQKTVFLSSAGVQYYAASEMSIKIMYLCNLLSNMGLWD